MAAYNKEKDVETAVQDDPKTREELKQVFENTARWQPGFKGFSADILVNINGKEEKGAVTVKGSQEIEISVQNEGLRKFAAENLASIAMHRGPRSFEESDGKHKLVYGEDDAHPLGRSVIMGGDGMSSFYRIKEGRIHQINRKTPRFSFSINVEESVKNEEGKFLTRKYTVYYFNGESGALKDVESYTDDYLRVGKADLPRSRRVINCENGAVVVSSMSLSNHKVL
ncbi:MAG: hypothetical protein A3K09_00695 [Nitrospinae bacterium RIFCSPLOWO2_12_FULL_47_7]|nr:MAG: hypothetical protein A3K09_00695 [Nitrospinae bacterium RIFCSPLOWO2_12_FULL_47_7]